MKIVEQTHESVTTSLARGETILHFPNTLEEVIEKHFFIMAYIQQYDLLTDEIKHEMLSLTQYITTLNQKPSSPLDGTRKLYANSKMVRFKTLSEKETKKSVYL